MACPGCNAELKLTPGLSKPIVDELKPLIALKKRVQKLALEKAEEQGILEDERLTDPASDYFGKPQQYADHRCSIYMCNTCKEPYFGGLIDCEQEANNAAQHQTKQEDLICHDCRAKELGVGVTKCRKHGKQQIDWKCMYCCSHALFTCGGNRFMCKPCHDIYPNAKVKDCKGNNCPLGIKHPPPTTDPNEKGKGAFPLGCGICRSERLIAESEKNAKEEKKIAAAQASPAKPKAKVAVAPKIQKVNPAIVAPKKPIKPVINKVSISFAKDNILGIDRKLNGKVGQPEQPSPRIKMIRKAPLDNKLNSAVNQPIKVYLPARPQSAIINEKVKAQISRIDRVNRKVGPRMS